MCGSVTRRAKSSTRGWCWAHLSSTAIAFCESGVLPCFELVMHRPRPLAQNKNCSPCAASRLRAAHTAQRARPEEVSAMRARRKLTLRCRASVVGAAGARAVPRGGTYLRVAERALRRKRDGTERRNQALWSLALEAARLRTARRALRRPPRSPSQVCESPDGRSEYRHLCFFREDKSLPLACLPPGRAPAPGTLPR